MYHLIVHWRQPLVFYLSYTITFTLREQKMQLYVSYSHLNKAIFFFLIFQKDIYTFIKKIFTEPSETVDILLFNYLRKF